MGKCTVRLCTEERKTADVMCKSHWFMVDKKIRDNIWRHYKAGERDLHIRSIRRAIRQVNDHEYEWD